MFKIKCYECGGTGDEYEYIDEHLGHYITCWRCGGNGRLTILNIIVFWFWDRIAPEWLIELDYQIRG